MIYFSMEAGKGYFRDNDPHVSQIVTTYAGRKAITELVAAIGCYCKWGWRFSI